MKDKIQAEYIQTKMYDREVKVGSLNLLYYPLFLVGDRYRKEKEKKNDKQIK